MTLQTGDAAPDFTLQTDCGKKVTLSELRGKKIVLFFYPKDNTPGCTKEACDFRDHYLTFQKHGVEIFGISRDNAKSHLKFKEKFALPFPLLIDENGDACSAYQVINKKNLFGNTFLGITRSTFIIDEVGKLQTIYRKVKVPGHVEQILNEIQ